jgi:hypothetical protein
MERHLLGAGGTIYAPSASELALLTLMPVPITTFSGTSETAVHTVSRRE